MPTPSKKMEIRCVALNKIELRQEGDRADSPSIAGQAAIFDALSEDLGGFREVVKPGAFTHTLREHPDVRAFFNHDSSRILGRVKAGTLTVEEDEVGLNFEIDPPAGPTGQDAVEAIRRGDVDQVSFGFIAINDRLIKLPDGQIVRELLDVDLFEISPVVFPAYPQTSAEVRSSVEKLRNAEVAEDSPTEPGKDDQPQTVPLALLQRQLDLIELE